MKKITTTREFGPDGTLVKETVTEEDTFVWNPPYPQTAPIWVVPPRVFPSTPNTYYPPVVTRQGRFTQPVVSHG